MKDGKISLNLLERAVEIWARKLHIPVFDNGDNSELGFYSKGLASMNIANDKAKIDNMEERLKIFKDNLLSELLKLDTSYIWLDTDYHPCKLLADAAKEANIPESQFSCKSSVAVHRNKVSASFGYGAEYINHYPLPNGGWLITTLSGSDIDKIKELIMDGNDLGLKIEKPSPIA